MSFKFIVTRQIAPKYDISTHQIQNFSGEGAPPVGRGTPPPHTPPPRSLRRLVLRRPPPVENSWIRHCSSLLYVQPGTDLSSVPGSTTLVVTAFFIGLSQEIWLSGAGMVPRY